MSSRSESSPGNQQRLAPGSWFMLFVLAFMQFTHIVDFMIMMPLGPRYLTEMHITPGQFGLLVSAYAFSACIAGILAALFIDRFDRKRCLLFLYAGFTVGTFFCGLSLDYYTLLAARALAGAFGGILGAVVLAIVGDVFPENRRGLATGVVMSSFSLATIAGVPLGLALAEWRGTGAPFLVLAALSAVMLLLAIPILPSMRGHMKEGLRKFVSPLQVLLDPPHLRAYLLMTCLVCTTFTIIPFLSAYLVLNVGWEQHDLWLIYVWGGGATLVTMAVFGRLADRFGKLRMFRILATLTMIPIVLMTTLGPSSLAWVLVVTTLFFILTSGRMVPALALITSSARPAYRGSFMSLNAAVQQLASGLASLIGGLILSQANATAPIEGFPIAGMLGCVMTLICLVLAGKVRPPLAETPEPTPDAPKGLVFVARTAPDVEREPLAPPA